MLRSTALAALLLTAATPGLAQTAGQAVPVGETRSLAPTASPTAAATIPNTFDTPARPVTPPPAASAAGPTQDEVTQADMAEGALRVVIADLAEGELDAALFTTDLANRLRPQLPTLRPIVQGFGALELIEPQGLSNGANQFLVTFENAATQWIVGLNDEGRVSALLFRPAPAVSSEPEPSEPAPATTGTTPPAPQTSAPAADDEG
jgi:septal ring-binding cell division protein DamX